MLIEAVLADNLCRMMLIDAYCLRELEDGTQQRRNVLALLKKKVATSGKYEFPSTRYTATELIHL